MGSNVIPFPFPKDKIEDRKDLPTTHDIIQFPQDPFGDVKLPKVPSKEEKFVQELLEESKLNQTGVNDPLANLLRELRLPPRK